MTHLARLAQEPPERSPSSLTAASPLAAELLHALAAAGGRLGEPGEFVGLGELRGVASLRHRLRPRPPGAGEEPRDRECELLRVDVAPDRRSGAAAQAELRVYVFEPRAPLSPQAPVVLYAHGGSIRPEPILGASLLPALVVEARACALGCRFVAVAHRGSSSHAAKRLFTLADRVDDLLLARRIAAAVTGARPQAPTIVIGNSMGGHVALMSLRALAARGVALLSPAVYSAEAHRAPLGPAFSAAIRRPASWRGSPAFAALADHLRGGGQALLLAKRDDEVIPAEVTATLVSLLREHGGDRSRAAFAPGRHSSRDPQAVAAILDLLRAAIELRP